MEAPAESGLYDTRPHPNPVTTKAIEKVEDWLSRMKGASIGIAGPQGAGKTTLIEYFCPANPGDTPSSEITRNWVRLRVSAPVEYVPLDFICHLVAGLCEAILLMHPLRGPSPTDSAPPTGSRSKQAWLWLRRVDATPGYPGMLSLVTLMGAVLLAAITIAGDEHLARAGVAVLAIGTLVAVTVFGRAASPIIPSPRPALSNLPRTLTMITSSTLTICLAGFLIAGFAVGQGRLTRQFPDGERRGWRGSRAAVRVRHGCRATRAPLEEPLSAQRWPPWRPALRCAGSRRTRLYWPGDALRPRQALPCWLSRWCRRSAFHSRRHAQLL